MAAAEKLAATVGKFPAPSLMCVLAELKRERSMRERVYPRLIDSGQLTEDQALYQQRCLEEAIDLLEGKTPAIDPGHTSRTPEPGEPVFSLLGRDMAAPQLIREWAFLRGLQIRQGVKPPTDQPKIAGAIRIADAMEAFRKRRMVRQVAATARAQQEPEPDAVPEAG